VDNYYSVSGEDVTVQYVLKALFLLSTGMPASLILVSSLVLNPSKNISKHAFCLNLHISPRTVLE